MRVHLDQHAVSKQTGQGLTWLFVICLILSALATPARGVAKLMDSIVLGELAGCSLLSALEGWLASRRNSSDPMSEGECAVAGIIPQRMAAFD